MHLAAQEDRVPVAEILVKHHSETDQQTKVRSHPWMGHNVSVISISLRWYLILLDCVCREGSVK